MQGNSMKRKNNFLYQLLLEWLFLEKFPNLKDAKIISVDLETQDPNLIKMGPGWARDDGRIVGIAISLILSSITLCIIFMIGIKKLAVEAR